MVITGDEKVAN